MTDAGRILTVGLLVAGLTLAAAGGVATSAVETASADVRPLDGEASPAVGQETTDENETVLHRNPDEYGEEGDLVGTETWLSDELSSRLSASADALEDGEYDEARDQVDGDYRRLYERYAEVAQQTGGQEAADRYDATGDAQRRLVDATESYAELQTEYERALEDGDDERARELARELEANATAVDEASDELQGRQGDLEDETGTDYSDADESIEAAEREIEREQEAVREEQFVRTELTLDVDEETVSFRDPLTAEGELRTTDGDAIANEEVRLDVGNGTETVETDDDGAFDLEYRPTAEALSTESLSVEYVPENESSYLGTETTVDVSIEQVEPSVTDLDVSEEASYGETVTVEGELVVEDEPVDNVTLAVVFGDEVVNETNVTDGEFDEEVEVPASIPDGERPLGVELAFEDRALAGTTETAPVTVLETETALSLDAARVDDRDVAVEGTFTTADGEPLANESVQVDVGGVTEPVAPDADGGFEETVTVPSDAEGDVTVTASHDGEGTSLAAAEADATVSLGGSDDGLASSLPAWTWLLLGLLAVVAFAGGLHRYRGESLERDESIGFGGRRDGPDRPAASRDVTDALLARAAAAHSSGRPDVAVRTCYVAVRRALADRIDVESGLTHWEFYRRWQRDGSDDLEAFLFDLTEAYERAAFDASGVSNEGAEGVLERARRLFADESADDASGR